MADTKTKNNKKAKKTLWILSVGLIIVISPAAAFLYLHFRFPAQETIEKRIILDDITVFSKDNTGTVSLEPFIVVCHEDKPGMSNILIADIKLSFSPEKRPDVMAGMFDIRTAILDSLQKTCSEMNRDEAQKALNKALETYKIDNVIISRYIIK